MRFIGKTTVIDGPFAEPKKLIAGYWLIETGSLAEAIDWARKCPSLTPGGTGELEIRRVYEDDDFGPEFTASLGFQGSTRSRIALRRSVFSAW